MYEYQFVDCPAQVKGHQFMADALRQVIETQSKAGWRLVQVLVLNPAAIPTTYQVIFERQRQG